MLATGLNTGIATSFAVLRCRLTLARAVFACAELAPVYAAQRAFDGVATRPIATEVAKDCLFKMTEFTIGLSVTTWIFQ